MNKRFSVMAALACGLASFATAAKASPIVTFASTVTFIESVSALHFSSSGLNDTLTVGVPDLIPHFASVTVDSGAWSVSNSPLTANFTFTMPSPSGATKDSGSITGGQVNGGGANGTLTVSWPSQPVEFNFTDGTKLQVTLGGLSNITCSGNNCLSSNDPYFMSATFLLLNGPTAAVTAVPEPGTLALLAAGLGGVGLLRWRRKRKLVS